MSALMLSIGSILRTAGSYVNFHCELSICLAASKKYVTVTCSSSFETDTVCAGKKFDVAVTVRPSTAVVGAAVVASVAGATVVGSAVVGASVAGSVVGATVVDSSSAFGSTTVTSAFAPVFVL